MIVVFGKQWKFFNEYYQNGANCCQEQGYQEQGQGWAICNKRLWPYRMSFVWIWLAEAVFTLGRNMICLNTNETSFVMKSLHIRQCIARIMVETWLFWAWLKQPREVVSVMIRPNTFKMGDGCGEEASAQKNQNCGYYEAKCLVENMANEEIQRQLSAMSRKNECNCYSNSSSILLLKCKNFVRIPWNGINYTTMHETCLKPTSDVTVHWTNMFRRNMLPLTLIMFWL